MKLSDNRISGPLRDIPLSLGVIAALLAPHVSAIRIIELLQRHQGLDKLAIPLQNALHSIPMQSTQQSNALGKMKRLLFGSWMRHPIHPVLSDVPIGALTGTTLLDLLWLLRKDNGLTRSADFTLTLGLLTATGAAATGLADWSAFDNTSRRAGLLHGLLSGVSLLADAGSLILRLTGRRRAAIVCSSTGYLILLFSSYPGGELIFMQEHQVKFENTTREPAMASSK